jgi:hypothetical protein
MGFGCQLLFILRTASNQIFLFEEVDDQFIKSVKRHIDIVARTKSNLPLSQNSKYSYFNKFKACLRCGFDEGYLNINYAGRVKSFEQAESQREYLTFSELQKLTGFYCIPTHGQVAGNGFDPLSLTVQNEELFDLTHGFWFSGHRLPLSAW